MTDVTQQMLADGRFLVDRLTDFGSDGDARTDDGERAWHGHVSPALSRFRAALSAMSRDDALEALRELLDEHDKAHGETKYTPAKQPPYSMTMDSLHRQTFAAMYAYVRNKLAQKPRS